MAKNRVVPERQKNKDNFMKPKKKSKPVFKHKAVVATRNNHPFKPSVSGSGNFFIKPTEKSKLSVSRSSENNDSTAERIKTKFDVNKKKHVDKFSADNAQANKESMPVSKKKPFDKKTYRLKKYSKKYKVQQWEEKRKHAVLRDYYRTVKEDEPKLEVEKIYEELNQDETDEKVNEENDNNFNTDIAENTSQPNSSKFHKNKKHFRKPHEEFGRVKEEKQRKREEFLKKKAEKEAAIKKCRMERAERSKKLSRKTKRGQPIMKYRIEMLLEKIQKSVNQ